LLRAIATAALVALGLLVVGLGQDASAQGKRALHRQRVGPKPGDMVKVARKGVWHFGIVTGKNSVVHRDGGYISHIGVRETSMRRFAGGCQVIVEPGRTRPREHVVRSAKVAAASGDLSYNPLWNNCEHEARKHAQGKRQSKQVKKAPLPIKAAALGMHMMTTPLRMMSIALTGGPKQTSKHTPTK
jgi:hypothetical protein